MEVGESRRNCTCLASDGMLGDNVLMCDPRRGGSEPEGEGGCSMVYMSVTRCDGRRIVLDQYPRMG